MSAQPQPEVGLVQQRARSVTRWAVVAHLVGLASIAAVAFQLRAVRGRPLSRADWHAVYLADTAAFVTGHAVVLLSLVGLVLLARWTRTTYETLGAMKVDGLPYTPSRAAWSFAYPVVQPWTSWRALSGLERVLAAALTSSQTPRAASDASGHYRDNAAEPTFEARDVPRTPVALAWTLWAIGQSVSVLITLLRPQAQTTRALVKHLWVDGLSQLAIAVSALLLMETVSTMTRHVAALSVTGDAGARS